MKLLSTLYKVLDACLTALAVVVGLRPDPTAVPVFVPIERDRDYRR